MTTSCFIWVVFVYFLFICSYQHLNWRQSKYLSSSVLASYTVNSDKRVMLCSDTSIQTYIPEVTIGRLLAIHQLIQGKHYLSFSVLNVRQTWTQTCTWSLRTTGRQKPKNISFRRTFSHFAQGNTSHDNWTNINFSTRHTNRSSYIIYTCKSKSKLQKYYKSICYHKSFIFIGYCRSYQPLVSKKYLQFVMKNVLLRTCKFLLWAIFNLAPRHWLSAHRYILENPEENLKARESPTVNSIPHMSSDLSNLDKQHRLPPRWSSIQL